MTDWDSEWPSNDRNRRYLRGEMGSGERDHFEAEVLFSDETYSETIVTEEKLLEEDEVIGEMLAKRAEERFGPLPRSQRPWRSWLAAAAVILVAGFTGLLTNSLSADLEVVHALPSYAARSSDALTLRLPKLAENVRIQIDLAEVSGDQRLWLELTADGEATGWSQQLTIDADKLGAVVIPVEEISPGLYLAELFDSRGKLAAVYRVRFVD